MATLILLIRIVKDKGGESIWVVIETKPLNKTCLHQHEFLRCEKLRRKPEEMVMREL